MGAMLDAVNALTDYLTKETSAISRQVAATQVHNRGQPDGAAVKSLTNGNVADTRAALATNPISQMGADTLNQITTTATQQMVNNVISKVNLTPIQNAVQGLFQLLATANSFESELAMSFARNAGTEILIEIQNKRNILAQINAQLVQLHNACAYILNSSPFFTAYLQQLIQAYNTMGTADTELLSVINTLTNQQKYNTVLFNDAIKKLTAAQALILPNRGADVSSIQGVKTLISTSIGRTTNQQALAAALAIPGITLQLGNSMINYTKSTVNLNLLLNTFADALEGFVDSFTSSPNLYQAAIDHVSAGESQLASLRADMANLLYPNASTVDVNSTSYTNQVTSQASMWGVKLAAIIQFLKFNPGAGAAQLDQTTASVLAYDTAVNTLESIDTIPYAGGTLPCPSAQEDPVYTVRQISNLMLTVNILVGTSQTTAQITQLFQRMQSMFGASAALLNQISNAITPFVHTTTTFTGAANAVVQQAVGIANKYNLDRVAGLITDGQIRNLMGVTPTTSTYTGNALGGMNAILTSLTASPSATDAQIQRITSLRDTVAAQKANDDLESNRSYQSSLDAMTADANARIALIQAMIDPAKQAAIQIDSADATTPQDTAESLMSNSIPGFNQNNTSAGTQLQS